MAITVFYTYVSWRVVIDFFFGTLIIAGSYKTRNI